MKKYIIEYGFNGTGVVRINAKSKKEAENKFYDGDYNMNAEEENGSNYEILEIKQQ